MNLDLTDRTSLLRSLPHGGIAAEVGVQRGDFAAVILQENQPRELWLIDCWRRQPASDYARLDPVTESADHNNNLAYVRDRFKECPQVTFLVGFSTRVAEALTPRFDVVYLDADHTPAAIRADLVAWWPLVKPGGWLSGHDFATTPWIGVEAAVREFAAERNLSLLVTQDSPYPSWAIQKAVE